MLKPNSHVTANLIKARELIADERNWCSGVMFDNKERMCALGALEIVGINTVRASKEVEALSAAGRSLFGEGIVSDVNDVHGHAAVMRMFDRAIELSLTE